jgi:hypothetical protein
MAQKGARVERQKIILLATLAALASCPIKSLPGQTLSLEYSTFLGGTSWDTGLGIAADAAGTVFVTGETYSGDFPISNPYQSSPGNDWETHIFVSCLSSSGSALIFSSYFGGQGSDAGKAIAVDSLSCPYIIGETYAPDFPTLNPYQASLAGASDAFVVKFSTSGSALVFSTYLGGADNEYCDALSLDGFGGVIAVGYTASADFPTVAAYQGELRGPSDAFLVTLSPSGSSLLRATYFGGNGLEYATGLKLDPDGGAYLCGYTASSDFPTRHAVQDSLAGLDDVFVSKFSSDASELVYSTFLGGYSYDFGSGLGISSDRCVFVTGYTFSPDFPIRNPYQASSYNAKNCSDAFVSKLAVGGSPLLYSTFLGGYNYDRGEGIIIDSEGSAIVVGIAGSSEFPTCATGLGGRPGTGDCFISRFSLTGENLLYSGLIGGSGYDCGYAIAPGTRASAYLTGETKSEDFPVVHPYQPGMAWYYYPDAFICKVSWAPTPMIPVPSPTPAHSPGPSPTSPAPSPEPSAAPTAEPSPRTTPSPEPISSPSPTPTRGPTLPPQKAVIASGDYNGDGTDDIAVFRASTGLWSVRDLTTAYYGISTDQAAPGDYDGDGSADIAVFRPASGQWFVRNFTRVYYGTNGDTTIPGDYDGDGISDIAVFRSATGRWYIKDQTSVVFGMNGDWPVPADYDAGGSLQMAVYRPGGGYWAVSGLTRFFFGGSNDWPLALDYDGDGIYEPTVFRPCDGMWAIRGITRHYIGICTDWARPGDYDGDGIDDLGIFRDYSSLWAVRELTRVYFGGTGDVPVTR